MIPLGGPVAAQGPVIPDFGEGSDCVVENRLFCPDWVRDNWSGTLQPALLEHVKLTIIAVAIGFVISFGAALLTHRLRLFEKPLVVFAAIVYTIPSLALFQLLVPITGLTTATVEVALVGYTLLILYRNILEGLRNVPPDVLEAARGMGMTDRQVITRVELPLALPLIFAGIRTAIVAVAGGGGLGDIIVNQAGYGLEGVVGAAICVSVLALAADGAVGLLQRAVTPAGLRVESRAFEADVTTGVSRRSRPMSKVDEQPG